MVCFVAVKMLHVLTRAWDNMFLAHGTSESWLRWGYQTLSIFRLVSNIKPLIAQKSDYDIYMGSSPSPRGWIHVKKVRNLAFWPKMEIWRTRCGTKAIYPRDKCSTAWSEWTVCYTYFTDGVSGITAIFIYSSMRKSPMSIRET